MVFYGSTLLRKVFENRNFLRKVYPEIKNCNKREKILKKKKFFGGIGLHWRKFGDILSLMSPNEVLDIKLRKTGFGQDPIYFVGLVCTPVRQLCLSGYF